MKNIRDSSLKKIIEYKKYKDLYDFYSLECRVALLMMVIMDITFATLKTKSDTNTIILDYISYLDTIGIALIGFLGFIVTGLAILTGAISSAVVKRLQEKKKIQALEKILLSFYLLGLVSAIIIILSFILHFVSKLPFNSIGQLNIILLSFISYLIVFSIFYAVKLIGNCLELFFIISNMQISDDVNEKTKSYVEQKFNYYQFLALKKAVLINHLISIEDYADEIKKMIETDNLSEQEKTLCMEMHNNLFSNNP